MTNDGGRRPVRDVGVRDRHGILQRLGKVTQPGAEDDSQIGCWLLASGCWLTQAAAQKHRGAFCLRVLIRDNRKPAMVAVTKFASVPASIARKPSRARSCRLVGASAPIPPI